MELLLPEELDLLQHPSFYQIKKRLGDKIQALLGDCSREIQPVMDACPNVLPEHIRQIPPKISKGENYLGFPWMILDQPRHFKPDDIFAVRTLCWFAHGFSITLHLSGASLQRTLPGLLRSAATFAEKGYYASVHTNPWQHHFEKDNYCLLRESVDPAAVIRHSAGLGFVKIMQRIATDRYATLPESTREFAQTIFGAMETTG